MIGTIVVWAHLSSETGKPTKDLAGEVVAVSSDGGKFRLLVKLSDGSLQSCDALDVRALQTGETVISTQVESRPQAKNLLGKKPKPEEEKK